MSQWDDDIEIGNEEILGESNRGLQDMDFVGAARALQRLGGAVGQMAPGRLTRGLPLTKRLRSPYKDSTQIGIKATATFTASAFSGGNTPTATGKTRVYKSFKPMKAVLTELVAVTWSASGHADQVKYAAVTDASDLVLISAFSGADNCFPNAPSESEGIPGPTFSNTALGVGISWPTINAGIDMTVSFAIEGSVLAATADPFSGSGSITGVTVTVRMSLLGPSLR